ncbi:MFS transporter [Actinomadura coerulea]|uniref:MFS transporter n=1 Tax=Actinomadura coerulea TaxID=46159 RepID=UPI0034413906
MHAQSARRASTPPPVRNETGAGPVGLRLGVLFGPAVFGVTSAGVALPKVAASLGSTPDDVAWVLTVHALALGVGTALFGRLADARGVRTTLLSGSLVLGLGAVVILLAPNLGVLVAGRFVLAAGSGAMTSGALALAAAGAPERRARVLAAFGATMAVFSASATLAGGAVTQWLTWRLTLALPVLSLAGVPLCLRLAVRPGSGRRMDPVGAGLVTATAAALLVFVQSPTLSLPTWAVASAGLAFLPAAACLAWRVRARPEGFVLRSVVADRAFVLAAAIGVGVYSGLFAVMYALPQILVKQQDWSVLSVGMALLPGAAAGAALSRSAGRLAPGRGGARLLAGAALSSALLLISAGTVGGGAWVLLTGASLAFAAFAVTQVVTTGLVSARIAPDLRGGAMGLLNLTFFAGGGIGSAAAAALSRSMPLTSALALVAALPLAAGLLALVQGGRRHPIAAGK